MEIYPADYDYCSPVNQGDVAEIDIARSVRELCGLLSRDIYLDMNLQHHVFLIASVLESKLVEYQVTNGPTNERSDMLSFLHLQDAVAAFDIIAMHGWNSFRKKNQ